MCGSMADIQSAAAEIRRGKKKKEERRRTNHSMQIYMVSLLHRATITTADVTESAQVCYSIHVLRQRGNPVVMRKKTPLC